jgi:hypothetical protein
MNTHKLTDALLEMKQQRALLDGAIKNIEGVLAALGNSSFVPETPASRKTANATASYIDLGVQILAEAGKPMHIAEIAKRISALKGKSIPRASVESSFIRHIKGTGPNPPRIAKSSPAHFGLSVWKPLFSVPDQGAA